MNCSISVKFRAKVYKDGPFYKLLTKDGLSFDFVPLRNKYAEEWVTE